MMHFDQLRILDFLGSTDINCLLKTLNHYKFQRSSAIIKQHFEQKYPSSFPTPYGSVFMSAHIHKGSHGSICTKCIYAHRHAQNSVSVCTSTIVFMDPYVQNVFICTDTHRSLYPCHYMSTCAHESLQEEKLEFNWILKKGKNKQNQQSHCFNTPIKPNANLTDVAGGFNKTHVRGELFLSSMLFRCTGADLFVFGSLQQGMHSILCQSVRLTIMRIQ